MPRKELRSGKTYGVDSPVTATATASASSANQSEENVAGPSVTTSTATTAATSSPAVHSSPAVSLPRSPALPNPTAVPSTSTAATPAPGWDEPVPDMSSLPPTPSSSRREKRRRDFRKDGDDYEREEDDPEHGTALAAARRGKRICVEDEGAEGEESSQRAVPATSTPNTTYAVNSAAAANAAEAKRPKLLVGATPAITGPVDPAIAAAIAAKAGKPKLLPLKTNKDRRPNGGKPRRSPDRDNQNLPLSRKRSGGRTKTDLLRAGLRTGTFPTHRKGPKEPASQPGPSRDAAGAVPQPGPSRDAAGAAPQPGPSSDAAGAAPQPGSSRDAAGADPQPDTNSREHWMSRGLDLDEFEQLRDLWAHKERRRQLYPMSSKFRASGNTRTGGPRYTLLETVRQRERERERERERVRDSALSQLQRLQRRPGFLRRIVQAGQRAVRSRFDAIRNRVSTYLHDRFEAYQTEQRLYEERQQEELRRRQEEQQRQQEELRRQQEEEQRRREAEEQEREEQARLQVRMEEHQRQDYQWFQQDWLRQQGHTDLPAVAPPPATPRPQTNMNPQGVNGCYHNPNWSVSASTSSGGSSDHSGENTHDPHRLWKSGKHRRNCERRLDNLLGRVRGQSSSAAYIQRHEGQPSQQSQRSQRRRRKTRSRTPQGHNSRYYLPDDLGDSSSEEEEDSMLPSPSSSSAAHKPVSNHAHSSSRIPSASSATNQQQSLAPFDPQIPQGTDGRFYVPDFPDNWSEIDSAMASPNDNSDSRSISNESFFGTYNRQQ
ncbi:hypothetical protein PG985_009079 [Apiospora marii]|uniref:uncharacterized protein n=1 Tax=Apiospora marii TaxID=335849 RepID=UPI00312D2615